MGNEEDNILREMQYFQQQLKQKQDELNRIQEQKKSNKENLLNNLNSLNTEEKKALMAYIQNQIKQDNFNPGEIDYNSLDLLNSGDGTKDFDSNLIKYKKHENDIPYEVFYQKYIERAKGKSGYSFLKMLKEDIDNAGKNLDMKTVKEKAASDVFELLKQFSIDKIKKFNGNG